MAIVRVGRIHGSGMRCALKRANVVPTEMVLVTGGTGFLGSRFIGKLAQVKGLAVRCLTRRVPEPHSPQITFVTADITHSSSVAKHLTDCDTIVHLAAVTGKQPPGEYFRVNRDATVALLQAAQSSGVKRFIYISSIAAKFEDPHYHYGRSKLEAEGQVQRSRLRWTILRPTMILGKGSTVLAGLARLAALPLMPVFGSGQTQVQPVFVDDLADLLTSIASNHEDLDSRILEVGGPEVTTIEALMNGIRQSKGLGSGTAIHLPVDGISTILRFAEPVFRPILPFTAGQLASFCHDGVADPDPWVNQFHPKMKSIEEMLNDVA